MHGEIILKADFTAPTNTGRGACRINVCKLFRLQLIGEVDWIEVLLNLSPLMKIMNILQAVF
jgi:hypothetical protein